MLERRAGKEVNVATTGLWKVRSGQFVGWRDGDQLYDSQGHHVGYFSGDVAYSTESKYVGEIYRDDWIGKKHGVSRSVGGVSSRLVSIGLVRRGNVQVPRNEGNLLRELAEAHPVSLHLTSASIGAGSVRNPVASSIGCCNVDTS